MKIRVLSDLHIDINHNYPLELKDKDVFTIVAGDTAGDPRESIDWIHKNIRRGIIITGNHIVYNHHKKPIQDLKQYFAAAFPPDSPVTYLDHMTGTISKEINGQIFIGTTLYSDYELYPHFSKERAMLDACSPRLGMTDFQLGLVRTKDGIRTVSPPDYRRWFIESKKEITRVVESNPDKDIIMVTHHCPTGLCCYCYRDEEYLNPSYASNMENFITQHPNIKLWITGHVHHRNTFKIGDCLIVQNPRGYEVRGEVGDFTPDFFVDTQTRQIERHPFYSRRWLLQREIDLQRSLVYG